MEIRDWVKKYLAIGWIVLPCSNNNKFPSVNWREYQDPDITQWENIPSLDWEHSTGIALITGKVSKIVVVDFDSLGDADFDSTVVAKTRSGGKHFYYKWAEGLRNTVRIEGAPIDFRGDGGLVIIPPSTALGKDGKVGNYTWIKPPTKENLENLPELPEKLKQYLISDKAQQSEKLNLSTYAGLSEGSRNDSLHRVACSLCNKYPQDQWDNGVYPILQGMNLSFKPPLGGGEVDVIFDQAKKFVKSHPKESLSSERTDELKYSQMSDKDLSTFVRRKSMAIGVPELDCKFTFPTGFYVICGNPGSGKGWFALWLARKFFELHKQKTAFYSLEMNEPLVRARLLQAWSDLSEEDFLNGGHTGKAMDLLKQDAIMVYCFGQDDLKYRTSENFEKDFVKHYEQGFRVFMFDHLHELSGSTVNDSNQKVVEEWGHTFQRIVKNYPDIWLIVFAQPNAASATKKLLGRNDMLGGKSITHKCEFFISLNRQLKEEDGEIKTDAENREILFWVDKNRITSHQYFGVNLFFGKDGNFYDRYNNQENENLINDVERIFNGQ